MGELSRGRAPPGLRTSPDPWGEEKEIRATGRAELEVMISTRVGWLEGGSMCLRRLGASGKESDRTLAMS